MVYTQNSTFLTFTLPSCQRRILLSSLFYSLRHSPFPQTQKTEKKRKIHLKFWRSIKTLLGFSGGERCLTIKETGIHWSIGFSLCTILASSISSASVTNLSFDIQVTFKNGRFSVPNLDCLRNQVTIMMTHDS